MALSQLLGQDQFLQVIQNTLGQTFDHLMSERGRFDGVVGVGPLSEEPVYHALDDAIAQVVEPSGVMTRGSFEISLKLALQFLNGLLFRWIRFGDGLRVGGQLGSQVLNYAASLGGRIQDCCCSRCRRPRWWNLRRHPTCSIQYMATPLTSPHHIGYKLSELFVPRANSPENPRLLDLAPGKTNGLGIPGSPVAFRFRVDWDSIFIAEGPRAAWSGVSRKTGVVPRAKFESYSVRWEMVVPRMDRSTSKPTPKVTIKDSRSDERVVTGSSPAGWPRVFGSVAKFMLTVAGLVALAFPLWIRAHRAEAKPIVGERSDGWIRAVSSPDGAEPMRRLVLYGPSLDTRDARLEFKWRVDRRPLGLAFRVLDSNNYYAMRVTPFEGSTSMFSVEHFMIYGGVEGAHERKLVTVPESGPVLDVRMEAERDTFTLYLDSQTSDRWSDGGLKKGGLGFMEQSGQPLGVEAVRVWFSSARGM